MWPAYLELICYPLTTLPFESVLLPHLRKMLPKNSMKRQGISCLKWEKLQKWTFQLNFILLKDPWNKRKDLYLKYRKISYHQKCYFWDEATDSWIRYENPNADWLCVKRLLYYAQVIIEIHILIHITIILIFCNIHFKISLSYIKEKCMLRE